MSAENVQRLGNQPLDLDAPPPERNSVTLGGKAFWMETFGDLSFGQQEHFRMVFVQIANIKETPDGEDGFFSERQHEMLCALEIRLCQLALPEIGEEEIALLRGPENDWRRSRLIDVFLRQPGMPGTALLQAQERQSRSIVARAQREQSTLQPLEQPAVPTKKSRRSSSTPTVEASPTGGNSPPAG